MYSLIFKEPCPRHCEHGIIRFSDRMGYDECDCESGYIFTEIKVTKADYEGLLERFSRLPF